MDLRIFILPLFLKGVQKYSLTICEIFWDVKKEFGGGRRGGGGGWA